MNTKLPIIEKKAQKKLPQMRQLCIYREICYFSFFLTATSS